jgi:hypothetical protein
MPEYISLKKRISAFIKTLSIYSLFLLLSVRVLAGTTAPVTTAEKDPSIPNGHLLWYVTPVEVTLESTDLESGVKEINYKIDSGNWIKKDFTDTLNLAPNPSFEISDGNAPIYTADWVTGTQDEFVTYTRDSTVYKPNFATTSIQISSTGGSWHSINNASSFAVSTSYNNMNAYAWIKTENVTGTAFFKIYAITQDQYGQQAISLISTSSTLTGTNDWTQIPLNFVVGVDNAIGVYMDIGIEGAGKIWVDAVNINSSLTPTTTFTVATDGEHTIQYYAVDKVGNTESTKSLSFKIDQTPPGNWRNSGAVRALFGNDHELYVWTNVDDTTSGLSTFTDKFQYTTRANPGFGRFPSLDSCNGTWDPSGWAILITPPFMPGSHTAYIITPRVDFCDSNWKICHYVRFYSEDMAGNVATKDMCINGPWIKVRGKGIVRANNNVDMISEAYEDNTDGLVETGGPSINFFDSSSKLYLNNTITPPDYNYDKFFGMTPSSKSQIATSGNLVSSTGVYYINGDYEITSQKVPNNYSSSTFNQIVFVNGRLRVSSAIQVNDSSTALFIVKGNIEISKSVATIKAGLIADGTISTAYDITEGEASSALNMNGIFIADKILFQRTLQGTQNERYPSDVITYEPKYVLKLNQYLGTNEVQWLSSD